MPARTQITDRDPIGGGDFDALARIRTATPFGTTPSR